MAKISTKKRFIHLSIPKLSIAVDSSGLKPFEKHFISFVFLKAMVSHIVSRIVSQTASHLILTILVIDILAQSDSV